jgi:azurin
MFTACQDSGSSSDNKEATPPAEAPAAQAPDANTPPAANGEEVAVTLNAGDDMKYDKTEITVKEGQTIKLTLHHTGKAPATAMGHNFVLLANGVDVGKFAAEAAVAKDNGYIPASMAADVLANTSIVGGGETTEVTFKAPAKGVYDFICSFPGHYGMMNGKLNVE